MYVCPLCEITDWRPDLIRVIVGNSALNHLAGRVLRGCATNFTIV